jgi:hypothetical protein
MLKRRMIVAPHNKIKYLAILKDRRSPEVGGLFMLG